MKRKLHIGGKIAVPGWEILDAVPGPHVDHLGNANSLSQFPNHAFDEIYASHVLEHFDYQSELSSTLKEWRRVLKPLGLLYISVPDLDVLAKLFIAKDRLTTEERFSVMRMMFGGHMDAYDYHLTGLNEDFLRCYLREAGFGAIKKMKIFDIFEDTSSMIFMNELISLNLIAKKLVDD